MKLELQFSALPTFGSGARTGRRCRRWGSFAAMIGCLVQPFAHCVAQPAKAELASGSSVTPDVRRLLGFDSQQVVPFPSTLHLLWSAGMETGTLEEWSVSPYQATPCGGQFSGAGGQAQASTDFARSGRWSAKLTIPGDSPTSSPAGTRMHRWCEPQRYSDLVYSVWFYLPEPVQVLPGGWTNWFQFKSKRPNGANDPFFFLGATGNRGDDGTHLRLTWWSGLKIEGPSKGQSGFRTWDSPLPVPVRRWFNVVTRYTCSGDFTGAIQVWQDGLEIFHLQQVRTRYPDGDCQWGVNNYGRGLSPDPMSLYIDDASIFGTH